MTPANFDVIVFGLGGMGSAAAYHLATRSQRVLGLEQFSPVHDKGSSHGASRIIRQAYHEDPAYVPLVQRAYQLWEKLQRDVEQPILRLTGGLMIGSATSSIVTGTLASAAQHNLPHEIFSSADLQRRFPALRPRPDDTAVFELRAGFLRPELAVQAHLELAAASGAELHFEEPIVHWTASPSGEGVEVTTGKGSYRARNLVLAPGAWAAQFLPELAVPFDVRRHAMCWFQPPAGVDLFAPDRFPVYIWDVDGSNVFYGFPAIDGSTGGVKIAMHSGGEPCTPAALSSDIPASSVEELRRYIRRFLPALNGELLRSVPCMYTLTPDEHFVIAQLSETPQVAIAVGFSGHGFKFSSVIGEILADLAISGTTSQSISLFSPDRFNAKKVRNQELEAP
ncbi:MAG TPA: N-methyl-L-tryptophan oxidase [Bryobacteraceae bacterium]|nr:N-methyl-L-tryptophan oxidase [Bryobacteraceae bacterium]